MQAFVHLHHKKINAPRPLQINGANIAFFSTPIRETSEFLTSEDGKIWRLRFFIDSAFEQTLFVEFNDNGPGNVSLLGRAYWCDNGKNADNDTRLISAASLFLRNSDSLTLAKGEQLSPNRTLLVDRDGFAYFSGDNDQFKRIVLCQALALAYVEVIKTCMAETTKCVRNNRTDETIALYENILRFNAAYYFTLPVLVDRHELFAAWKVLCEHYHLKVLSQELTLQLSDVAALLSGQREKQKAADEAKRQAEEAASRELEKQALATQKAREDKADKRRSSLLSVVSVLLTAMSLLSLFQLTPTQFVDNVSQWKHALWKSGADKTAESAAKLDVARKAKD